MRAKEIEAKVNMAVNMDEYEYEYGKILKILQILDLDFNPVERTALNV